MKLKSILLAATFALSLPAFACTEEAISFASKMTEEAQNRFEQGLSSITEVQEAKAYFAATLFCSDANNFEKCQEAVTAYSDNLEAVQAGHEVGIRTLADVIAVHNKLVETQLKCKEIEKKSTQQ